MMMGPYSSLPYGNEIEVQFPGRDAPDKINRCS